LQNSTQFDLSPVEIEGGPENSSTVACSLGDVSLMRETEKYRELFGGRGNTSWELDNYICFGRILI
jgi:hypothetical protein